MSHNDAMHRIDALLSHVWMVRTFIKHSEESQDEPQLLEIQRVLYDAMLALGPAWKAQDAEAYLKQSRKKLSKLRAATDLFADVQPEISTHTNFQMAVNSLKHAVGEIETVLAELSSR